MAILNEQPHLNLHRPILWPNGKLAYGIELWGEVSKEWPAKLRLLNATWIARHPVEDLYIVVINGNVHSHVTLPELLEIYESGELPPDCIKLNDGWWKWAEAVDEYNTVIAYSMGREARNERMRLLGFESRLRGVLVSVE